MIKCVIKTKERFSRSVIARVCCNEMFVIFLKDLATVHISRVSVILRCALGKSCSLSSVKTFKVKGSGMTVTGSSLIMES